MILGDLGAEVIKVERPDVGDDTRAWGPPFVANESVYFLSVNRNKKSVCVDLKHPSGVTIVQELAQRCDVLVENFLPGKLDKMSLGYEDLSRLNPQLIYCSISGYGQSGPRSQTPGYDSIASAMSGMMHITGPEGGEPVRPGVAMTDLAAGLYAHGAVMAALLQRQRTGTGSHIDCNLLSAQVSCLSHIAANYLNCGWEARRWGTAHESIVPYQAFTTKDGHVVVAAGNDKQFVKVCQVLHLRELTEEPRYRTNKLRVQNRKQLIETLSHRYTHTGTHTQEHTQVHTHRYTHTGTHTGTYTQVHTHTGTYTQEHTGTHTQVHTGTHTQVHTQVHTHRYTHTQVHTHRNTQVHTHRYTHTGTHRYTHTQVHTHRNTQVHTHRYTQVHTHRYTHRYIHTGTHTHRYIHTGTHRYTHTGTHTQVHTGTHTQVHTHTGTHTGTYTQVHTHTGTHRYTHTRTHTGTHTQVHTHRYTHGYTRRYTHRYTHRVTWCCSDHFKVVFSARFRQHTTSEWLRFFEGSGVPVGPINSIQEVFCDTQVKHNNLIREMKHPTAGLIRVPGPAVHYSSFEPPEATPPPLIGQHTVQVLRNTLSYTDDAIKSLLASKVVAQNVAS
uniref:Succinyl-CoA:glutarate-CoA transferase n=1 Tax=Takifugu rubripes TaxID=31033 RepID=A0A674PHZ7_TAKRU